MKKLVVAISGSSGSVYANRLFSKLKEYKGDLTVGVVMSNNARINWELELGPYSEESIPFRVYGNKDFMAPFASGSSKFDTMIIIPSSMGIIGRIAGGISDDLITRTADVMLKERRKLIIVPRETPYNLIHLKNMTSSTEAGAIICPATPSFYSIPTTIEQLLDTVVDRVLDLAGFDFTTYRWGE